MRNKKYLLSFSLFSLLLSVAFFCTNPAAKNESVSIIHAQALNNLIAMEHWLDSSFIPLCEKNAPIQVLKESYREGRRRFKKTGYLIHYFSPSSAQQIIGAALDDIETEEHIIQEPGGFQVMEELLFSGNTTVNNNELKREAKKMRSIFYRLHSIWEQESFRDDQLFDAIRTDIVRITALQLTGFDAPVSLEGLNEIPVALQAYLSALSAYEEKIPIQTFQLLTTYLQKAIEFVEERKNDFNGFPRLAFITAFLNPISTHLLQAQKESGIAVLNNVGALNMTRNHIFSDSVFTENFFTPDPTSHLNAAKIALGRKIFYDPILSSSNKVSCATCHHPEKAFTDGRTTSIAAASQGNLKRNTPTLLYAGLQKAQFFDMRVTFLEDQVKDVVENKDEIHGNLEDAVKKLMESPEYSSLFSSAFPAEKKAISSRGIQIALASYIRSLNPFNSRFDTYMRGGKTPLSDAERNGFNLFAGKAKCATCHFIPLFNGTVPPAFAESEGEVLGVMNQPGSASIDADNGRFDIYKIENFRHAFKTPTLRNIEKTAPYMHHGAYKTLEEVMDFYNNGGAGGRGIALDNQTLPPDSLHLSEQETAHIIAFMKTLTDKPGNY